MMFAILALRFSLVACTGAGVGDISNQTYNGLQAAVGCTCDQSCLRDKCAGSDCVKCLSSPDLIKDCEMLPDIGDCTKTAKSLKKIICGPSPPGPTPGPPYPPTPAPTPGPPYPPTPVPTYPPTPGPTPSPYGPTPSPYAPTPYAPTPGPQVQGGQLSANYMCLDVPGGYLYNGAALQMWSCNGMAQQNWAFAEDAWAIQVGSDTSYCVDAGDMSSSKLQLWNCNGFDQQRFGYDSDMMTIYLANSRSDASLCLQPDGENQGDQVSVQLCNSREFAQKWSYEDGILG